MTSGELRQLVHIERRISELDRLITRLRSRAYGVRAQSMDGMPRATDMGRKTEEAAIEIADMMQERDKLMRAARRTERYIADIKDPYIKRIYVMRYIQGYSWVQIAARIGGATPDSLRKIAARYLEGGNRCQPRGKK